MEILFGKSENRRLKHFNTDKTLQNFPVIVY